MYIYIHKHTHTRVCVCLIRENITYKIYWFCITVRMCEECIALRSGYVMTQVCNDICTTDCNIPTSLEKIAVCHLLLCAEEILPYL